MIYNYEAFYRKTGIRFKNDIKDPPVVPFDSIKIPLNSSLHLPQFNPEEGFEIPQNLFMLSEYSKRMYCTIIEEYPFEPEKGDYRFTYDKTKQETMAYYRDNTKIADPHETVITDNYTVHLFAYGLLNRRINYFKTRRSNEMYKWCNHYRTVFHTINDYANKDNRNHFVVLDIPKAIPSIPSLQKRVDDEFARPLLRYFRSEDNWMILSLWKMFHGVGSYIFQDLEPDNYNNVNIIWKSGTVCMVVNLGTLLSFNQAHNPNGDLGEYQFSTQVLNSFLMLHETYSSVPVNSSQDDEVVDVNDEMSDEDTKKINDVLDSLMGPASTKPVLLDTDTVKTERIRNERVIKGASDIDLGITETDIDEDSVVGERLANLVLTDSEERPDFDDEDEDDETSNDLAYTAYTASSNSVLDSGDTVTRIATKAARDGILTAGELRHTTKLANKYKSLKNPYDSKTAFEDVLNVTEEDVSLSDESTVVSEATKGLIPDESMYQSSLKRFDEKYIEQVMPKHIVRSVMSLANIGISVQDYDIEKVSNINDDYEIHSVKVATINGKTSTVRFRIPSVNEYGEFRLGGIKSRMRKQWSDLPIRKISDSEVALTSYYSKLFVKRTPRAAYNYERWLTNLIIELGIDDTNNDITNLKLNNVFDNYSKLPREYTMIAKRISSFDCKGYRFYFDVSKLDDNFSHKLKGHGVIHLAHAIDDPKDLILMDDKTGQIILKDHHTTLLEFLGLGEDRKVPQDYAEIKMFGKPIPLAFILGYQIGLGNLLKTLDVKYERLTTVPSEMSSTHLILRFKDEVLAIPNTEEYACMVLGGFNRFHNDIKSYSVYAFDDREVYSNVFENNRVDLRFLKECTTMFPMWVDHITYDILVEMGEPTDLVGLLLRASGMLLSDYHPDAIDTSQMRVRGYERFSGMVYSELAREARSFNFKPNRKDKTFSVNPEAIWYAIRNDNSVTPVEESNPVHSLKEQEVVVYIGEGGRSNVTMTAPTRKFHKNAMGIVSEATVDSQHVGTITYLTANPNFNSLYGTTTAIDPTVSKPPAQLVSTSMLLAPGADIDDPKRTNFTAVQNSQTMGTNGYKLLPVRTGYERVIGNRTSDTFCKVAKLDGEVTDRDDKTNTLTVTYSDGSVDKMSTATVYAPWSGKLIAQPIVCDLKKGDKFVTGDVLTYNSSFFKKDKLLPNQVSLTMASLARIAIIEGGDVYEDSCAMSLELSNRLGADIAHVRNIVLDGAQDIIDLVEVGDEVNPDSILCTIVNSQTDSSFYDEQTLSLLEKIGSTSPKAKYHGVISKIEVLYTGEVEDMPQNVQDVALASDKALYRTARKLGTTVTDGRVDIGHRIDGNGLGLNQVVIKVYMVSPLTMATGDKLVVSNQLKATVARVWTDNNRDESGVPFDAFFSGQSIDNRVVDSPFLIGSTSTLLLEVTSRAIDHYFN